MVTSPALGILAAPTLARVAVILKRERNRSVLKVRLVDLLEKFLCCKRDFSETIDFEVRPQMRSKH